MSQAGTDVNHAKTISGVSSADGVTIIVPYVDPVTHRLYVNSVGGGGGSTFVNNEIVSGSNTTWTLAQTPLAGTQHIYGNGQRLTPGAGNDYTITGTTITTANPFSAGTILADYQTS